MENSAVEWFNQELVDRQNGNGDSRSRDEIFEQAKEMEKEQKILLVERLMEYTKESQSVLGNDEREASEFVDIFYKETFKKK